MDNIHGKAIEFCKNGDLKGLINLNNLGANIEEEEEEEDCFRLACKIGQLNIIKYLVDLGGNMFDFGYGFTRSCKNGHLDVAKYFVTQEVDIHGEGELALQLACENGRLEIVKYLVSLKADIHIYDDYPFQLACKGGHLNVVKYLVECGVDMDNSGLAFRWACKSGHSGVAKYILSITSCDQAYIKRVVCSTDTNVISTLKYLNLSCQYFCENCSMELPFHGSTVWPPEPSEVSC